MNALPLQPPSRHRPPLALLLAALIACAPLLADAQNPQHLAFRHVLTDQLPSIGYLNVIAQGPQGYMWFGGANGLAQYDGYSLRIYRQDEATSQGLPHNFTNDLLLTADGHFWVATRGGIARFEPATETFTHFAAPPQSGSGALSVNSIAEDASGRLWLGTAVGLYEFEPNSGEFIFHSLFARQTTANLVRPENTNIWKVVEDRDGYLWLGSQTRGVIRFHPDSGAKLHYSQADQPSRISFDDVRELHVDSNNQIWAGTYGGGLNLLNRDTDRFEPVAHDLTEKSATVWAVQEDSKGNLWIGDGSAVYVRAPGAETFARFSHAANVPESLGNYVVNEIFEDRAGDIWLGFFPSGVDLVDQQASAFRNYNHNPQDSNSVADGGILSSFEDAQGRLWIGAGYGLNHFDPASNSFTRYNHNPNEADGLNGNTILSVIQDDARNLWLGVWSGGLNKLDLDTGEFTHYLPEEGDASSLMGREPWSLMQDSEGYIWAATEEGVNRYNPETDTFTRFLPAPELADGHDRLYTRVIYEDRRNNLWVGAETGFYRLDRTTGAFTRYQHKAGDPSSLSNNFVLAVYEDSAGRLWLGTDGGGLNLFDRETGSFTAFTTEHGLPDDVVAGIIEDGDGYLWLGTQRGIARFDPVDQTFRNYDKRHGLSDNLFNRNTPLLTQTGELFFGNSKGFTLFDPKAMPFNDAPPQVVLRDLKILNESVPVGPDSPLQQALGQTKAITLEHDQSVLSLSFAALDYRLPEENQYAYRLKGFDATWNHVGNERTATYTNLDPGSYRFEVIGSNADGVWSDEPTTLTIDVLPPLWRTWWAYGIYLLAGGFVLWWFIRVQRLKVSYEHQKVEQERAHVRRLMELDQLKDDVMRNLDKKVAERTAELHRKNDSLRDAQKALQQANEKLEMASLSDPLTQLYNRRFVNKFIPADISIVERDYHTWLAKVRDGEPASLPVESNLIFMVMDVDHFKTVNDNHGHGAGDRVLEQMSRLLETVLRDSDYLVRWGGEEFLLVARFCSREEGVALAERVRHTVATCEFDIGKDQKLKTTCSIGLAVYPFYCHAPEAVSWEQVIDTADRALYTAKHTGRNKWVYLAGPTRYRGPIFNPAAHEDLDALKQQGAVEVSTCDTLATQP